MGGCVKMLEIEIDGIKAWVYVCIVPNIPYRLLLG
jgi:hypothetical protein